MANPKIEALQQVKNRIGERLPGELRNVVQFSELNDIFTRLSAAVNDMEGAKITGVDIRTRAEGLRDTATSSQKKVVELSRRAERDFQRAARERSGWQPSPFDREIRDRFSQLDKSQKMKALQSFILEQNGGAMAAVLDAPSFLTDVSPEDNERFKDQFFQTVVPEIWESRRHYQDLREHVNAATKLALCVAEEGMGNG